MWFLPKLNASKWLPEVFWQAQCKVVSFLLGSYLSVLWIMRIYFFIRIIIHYSIEHETSKYYWQSRTKIYNQIWNLKRNFLDINILHASVNHIVYWFLNGYHSIHMIPFISWFFLRLIANPSSADRGSSRADGPLLPPQWPHGYFTAMYLFSQNVFSFVKGMALTYTAFGKLLLVGCRCCSSGVNSCSVSGHLIHILR